MKIQTTYACINTSINCTTSKTFRLNSFSKERLFDATNENLKCLRKILEFNVKNEIKFFRIGSGLVPFASHPKAKNINWENKFKKEFEELGKFIKKNDLRITMHPDQFVVLNSPNDKVVENSVKEISYHARVLDLMKLDGKNKIEIHIGGVYGDKEESVKRFIKNFRKLSKKIKKRIAIENDGPLYGISDCLKISKKIKTPVIFDIFHQEVFLKSGGKEKKSLKTLIVESGRTWKKKDGVQILHYSNQSKEKRKGAHSEKIDSKKFREFILFLKKNFKNAKFDVILEVKNKEKSVFMAQNIIKNIYCGKDE